MYLPYFVAYMAAGFIVSLVVFFWALNHGQFRDQKRARFLPLDGMRAARPVEMTRRWRIETYGLVALVCLGLAGSAAVIIFALVH
jgi:cbb3-type cytochrome oxidase maturation protein